MPNAARCHGPNSPKVNLKLWSWRHRGTRILVPTLGPAHTWCIGRQGPTILCILHIGRAMAKSHPVISVAHWLTDPVCWYKQKLCKQFAVISFDTTMRLVYAASVAGRRYTETECCKSEDRRRRPVHHWIRKKKKQQPIIINIVLEKIFININLFAAVSLFSTKATKQKVGVVVERHWSDFLINIQLISLLFSKSNMINIYMFLQFIFFFRLSCCDDN